MDAFVQQLNNSERQPLFVDDVPSHLTLKVSEFAVLCDWCILPRRIPLDVVPVEGRLCCAFPSTYRSFVRRYEFPAFELGPIEFAESYMVDEYECLLDSLEPQFSVLQYCGNHRLIPFGADANGSFDPICFNTSLVDADGEHPIVRVDHEAALSFDKLQFVQIAGSLPQLFEACPLKPKA